MDESQNTPAAGSAQPQGAQPANNTAATPVTTTGQSAPAAPIGNDGKAVVQNGSGFHFVIPPHPNTVFDDAEFLSLLEGSISLSMEEKKRVIEAIPRLGQPQIDELIKIFKEERVKFAELEAQYGDEVAKLKKQRENEFETAKVQEVNKAEEMDEAAQEAAEAEALRRKLLGQ